MSGLETSFALLPQYILYTFFAILALVIGLIVLSFWRNIAPAAPGVVLGYMEVIGIYGNRLFRRFEGTVVDASNVFLNSQYENEFKESLLGEIKLVTEKKENSELSMAKKDFEDCKIHDVCRVFVMREGLFDKHVFVQWGNLNPLSEYAAKEEKPKFTFANLFVSRGVIRGELYTFPVKWDVWRIGTCNVHLFKPNPESVASKEVEVPTYLAKIALHIPAVVEFEEQLKTEREKNTNLRREFIKVLGKSSLTATERDYYKGLTGQIGTEPPLGQAPALPPKHRLTIRDVILAGVPALIGYYIVSQYFTKYDPLFGGLIGLVVGAYLAWRRKPS